MNIVYRMLSVMVFLGCYNKISTTGWLADTNFILSEMQVHNAIVGSGSGEGLTWILTCWVFTW